ncbi:PREDICTED: uncharacterized protein LOC105142097 isoform X1 [Populus euphratica]|uniref:Uncharacterized protein LOC105142097 isoform X1 n=1 Tax=Populus euphratica TaxID=75702 RepID=A0AAJ6VIQ4_POPEU|nr:PREDICTED: uncharacterized protein LOC105142097 isoform X1 [Populus euphratica]
MKLSVTCFLLSPPDRLFYLASAPPDPKKGSCLCSLLIAVSMICSIYFVGSAFVGKQYKERLNAWKLIEAVQKSDECKDRCRPSGSVSLPQGIVNEKSNYKMQPLWGSSLNDDNPQPLASLLAIAVGIKQKEIVDRIITKFPLSDFVVMLFHYDGVVDKWRDLSWSDSAIHVSAVNQTKWWFAKRFLHPDIVAEYNYIFLWDEDLGVENFNPRRYLSIVKEEGLEVSQPALDPARSTIHNPITTRTRNSRAHRKILKLKGNRRCYNNSTLPPCTGWVEMMAPVFSKAAWRCTWYMIQNDLIHAWGLDRKLGHCAQGDWTKNVGVVDAEYVVHLGLSTLGVFNGSEVLLSESEEVDRRPQVRTQSYVEMNIFHKRWEDAVNEDRCWVDPYQQFANQTRY